MWVMMDVPQSEAHRLALGLEVIFRPDDARDEIATGSIGWISTAVDEVTRTLKVRARVPNTDASLRANSFDREAIRVVYTWKTRANAAFDGGSAGVPEELYSPEFGRAINQVLESRSDSEGVEAIRTLCTFPFVRVRVASAFAYWLRPNDFQLIDRRSTEALDLGFMDADYTPENYVRFCELSRDLGRAHALTLRQIDRALFAYHKLIEAGYFLES